MKDQKIMILWCKGVLFGKLMFAKIVNIIEKNIYTCRNITIDCKFV